MRSLVDGSGKRQAVSGTQADMDTYVVVDMMELRSQIDKAVLFSGDGDMCPVVEALQRKGVRVVVVSAEANVSAQLRAMVDEYVELNDIRGEIGFRRRISDCQVHYNPA
jgi:uncharacterized LabA/DUF88 family protein